MRAYLLGAVLFTPALVFAEQTVLVTASRTSDEDVATIDRATLERTTSPTLLPALNRLPGIRAFSKDGNGGGSYLGIEGGEPNYTLVLLDGVRMNDPSNSQGGGFDFAQISPMLLERVDVANGSHSAVMGADALAGVVQMQLRRPTAGERSLRFDSRADSSGGLGEEASLGYGWQSGGLLLDGGWLDGGALTPGSTLERNHGLLRAVQDFGGMALSGFAYHADTRRETYPEDSGGPRYAVNRQRESRRTSLDVASFDLTRSGDVALRPHLAFNYSGQQAAIDTPAIVPGVFGGVPAIISDTRFERIELTGDVRWTVNPLLTLAVGAQYQHEDGRSRGAIDFGFRLPADFRISRSVASGFFEGTLTPLPRFAITYGTRIDAPDQMDVNVSHSGRLEYQLYDDGPQVFAGVAEGFKLPSLYALAYPLIANPKLLPERALSVNAGLRQTSGRVTWRLAGFRNRYEDLIDFDPVLFTNVNRLSVTTHGGEGSVAVQLSRTLQASGNLTYLTVDSLTPLRSRPKWQGAAALVWQARPQLSFDSGLDFNTSFFDSAIPTGLVRGKGHVDLHAGARWQALPQVAFTLGLDNLLDQHYEDAVGFAAPGRTVMLGLSLAL